MSLAKELTLHKVEAGAGGADAHCTAAEVILDHPKNPTKTSHSERSPSHGPQSTF